MNQNSVDHKLDLDLLMTELGRYGVSIAGIQETLVMMHVQQKGTHFCTQGAPYQMTTIMRRGIKVLELHWMVKLQ